MPPSPTDPPTSEYEQLVTTLETRLRATAHTRAQAALQRLRESAQQVDLSNPDLAALFQSAAANIVWATHQLEHDLQEQRAQREAEPHLVIEGEVGQPPASPPPSEKE